MQNKIPYIPFKQFAYRTPVFAVHDLVKEDYSKIYRSSQFCEAIFLASPDLYMDYENWLKGELNEIKTAKLFPSLLKYYLRMSNRCTPFGLFAGCNVGTISDKDEIILSDIDEHKSVTRLDMNFLCSLIKDITSIKNVRKQLKYIPNTSLYESGDNYRYVEYKYVKARRKHYLISIEKDPYLEQVIKCAETGMLLKDLSALLIDGEVTHQDAEEYLLDLIENQILVSELEPAVTGKDLLKELTDKLKELEQTEQIVLFLVEIKNMLQKIDERPIGRPIGLYQNLINTLKERKTSFEPKYLFQSDLNIKTKSATISPELINSVMQGISALNKLTARNENPDIKKFKEEFLKRYEDEEIPLVEALDIETGIGFANKGNLSGDINPLIHDLGTLSKGNRTPSIHLSAQQLFIQKKFEEYLTNSTQQVIEISDDELNHLPENWSDLPNTIMAMIEVLYKGEKKNGNLPQVRIVTVGGASAANLLSRFCHISKDVHQLVQSITRRDQELENDKILAEIVHLPESRTGNILFRPTIRDYEIPYLANASVNRKNVIPITDIMVSVSPYHGIKLRSKRLGKEVIPKMTTAHNFSFNALPIYQFLCSLQFQNKTVGLGFRWGSLLDKKQFLPKVMYKNIILSPAIWNIKWKEVKDFPTIESNRFYDSVLKFKEKRNIADSVLLVQGDNKLPIDFNHEPSVQLLFKEIKKRDFVLEENLFLKGNGIIQRESENFTNQLILCFGKNEK